MLKKNECSYVDRISYDLKFLSLNLSGSSRAWCRSSSNRKRALRENFISVSCRHRSGIATIGQRNWIIQGNASWYSSGWSERCKGKDLILLMVLIQVTVHRHFFNVWNHWDDILKAQYVLFFLFVVTFENHMEFFY